METVLASGADKGFFCHLQGLVQSIRDKPEGKDIPICIFDLGLDEFQVKWLEKRNVQVIDYNDNQVIIKQEKNNAFLKSAIVRVFLPKFISAQIIIWIDADTWVQDWKAIRLYQQAALTGGIGVTPEVSRSYRGCFRDHISFRKLCYKQYEIAFGREMADLMGDLPIINAGIFSLLKNSPIWDIWQKIVLEVCQKASDNIHQIYADQIALNYGIYSGTIAPFQFLPAYCNWGCHQSIPALDTITGKFVEPFIPHETIGIMHLTGITKNQDLFDIITVNGTQVKIPIRYLGNGEWWKYN